MVRRAALSLLLTAAMLSLFACQPSFEVRKVRIKGKVYEIEIYKTGLQHGRVHGPFDRNGQRVPSTLNGPQLLDHMLPANDPSPLDVGSGVAQDVMPKRRTAEVPIGTLFAVSTDGKLYDWNTVTGAVRTLDTKEDLKGLAVAPDNQTIYSVSRGPFSDFSPVRLNRVLRVDVASLAITGSVALPTGESAWSLEASPDGRFLYVSVVNDATYVIDLSGAMRVANVIRYTLGGRPVSKITPDGGLLFVAGGTQVVVIDTLAQRVSHTIPEPATHIDIDPSGSLLYLAPVFGPLVDNPKPPPQRTSLRGVAIYDISTSTRVRHIPVTDIHPNMAMTLTKDGNFLVVAHISNDPVTNLNGPFVTKVIDLETDTVIEEHGQINPQGIGERVILTRAPSVVDP